MSFDNENNENGQSENPSPGRGDAAGEAEPSHAENSPTDAPAAEVSGAEALPSGGSTVIPAEAGIHPDDWTRNERLRAWEEKIFRGELTLADVDEVIKRARLARTQTEAAQNEDQPPDEKPQTSARKREANRRNGRKSRGPVTEKGKQIAALNLQHRRSPRLLGLAEARTLNQDPEAAEQLYRQLIEPYGPTPPPLLAVHLQDFARLQLELQAWERIRDARLEARAEENDLERRRRLWETYRDLPGTAKEVFDVGLGRLEPSPAKFKRQIQCLGALKEQLLQRDFDIEPLLHMLYGKDLDPNSDRARTICIRCERLMDPKSSEPVAEDQFEDLLDKVEEEEQDARRAYCLSVEEKRMTWSASLARLGPTRDDLWMERQGDQLRRAIDRKQWVITGLLQTLGLAQPARSNNGPQPAAGGSQTPPLPPPSKNVPSNPRSSLESNNSVGSTQAPNPRSPLESVNAKKAEPKTAPAQEPPRPGRNTGVSNAKSKHYTKSRVESRKLKLKRAES